MIKSSFNLVHKPVLLNESINLLTNKKNTIFIDGTFGDGGHTRAFLEKNKTCKVYAIDRDPNVKENARFFQKKYNRDAENQLRYFLVLNSLKTGCVWSKSPQFF